MWIGVLWAGVRVAMWIIHVGGKFRHGLLEKSLIFFQDFEAWKFLTLDVQPRDPWLLDVCGISVPKTDSP